MIPALSVKSFRRSCVLVMMFVMAMSVSFSSAQSLFAADDDKLSLESEKQILPVPPLFITPLESNSDARLLGGQGGGNIGDPCEQDYDCNSEYCRAIGKVCADPSCGNDIIEGREGCDDGNVLDGDGCDNNCQVETGASCSDQGGNFTCLAVSECSNQNGICSRDASSSCATNCCCEVSGSSCPVGTSDTAAGLDCPACFKAQENGDGCFECLEDPSPNCIECPSSAACKLDSDDKGPDNSIVDCSISLSLGGSTDLKPGESTTVTAQVSCEGSSSERERESLFDQLIGAETAWAVNGTTENIAVNYSALSVPKKKSGYDCLNQAVSWNMGGQEAASFSPSGQSVTITCQKEGSPSVWAYMTGNCADVSPSSQVSITCLAECSSNADCPGGVCQEDGTCSDQECLQHSDCSPSTYCSSDGSCQSSSTSMTLTSGSQKIPAGGTGSFALSMDVNGGRGNDGNILITSSKGSVDTSSVSFQLISSSYNYNITLTCPENLNSNVSVSAKYTPSSGGQGSQKQVSVQCGFCGDTIKVAAEDCDDGNNEDGDGCSSDCSLEWVCGDGEIEGSEECDDSNDVPGDGCDENCIQEVCGNGVAQTNEACDDGNTIAGDGCSATCGSETDCGNGTLDAGEQCDDANLVGGDGCDETCTSEVCGNGIVQGSEECDDGNTTSNDGCTASCVEEVCGDNIVQSSEECDDGNTTNGDGCSGSCDTETCGDINAAYVGNQSECTECAKKHVVTASLTCYECADSVAASDASLSSGYSALGFSCSSLQSSGDSCAGSCYAEQALPKACPTEFPIEVNLPSEIQKACCVCNSVDLTSCSDGSAITMCVVGNGPGLLDGGDAGVQTVSETPKCTSVVASVPSNQTSIVVGSDGTCKPVCEDCVCGSKVGQACRESTTEA